ncbi:MAG: ATP-binding protein [Thermoanaerobaculia bacterium]
MPSREKTLELTLYERVKELTCLYSIAHLASDPDLSLSEMMQRIAELLPSGWQYPEITSARITVDGASFATPEFRPSPFRQRADIVVDHETCGEVLIIYREPRPDADEGPFLNEERNLLNAVASRLGLIVARRRAERDRANLTEQLHHADRLATIGQLAAGLAHELNEPLAAILGLAQLSSKAPQVPEPVVRDLEKIIKAALHARDVIRNLLLFARRVPPARTKVRLNELVEQALALVEARRTDTGIELVRSLEERLPDLTADPSQIRQVLVNLLVNAVQAMSRGGRLDVQTRSEADHVLVAITDTGVGMSADVRRRLYTPFFTTKDVGEGTGLGLAVASGIVSSHGGTIHVESEVGHGSRFEVRLPLTPPLSANLGSDGIPR